MRFWRLVPVAAVGAVLAISAAALPGGLLPSALEFALWSAVFLSSGLVALLGSAAAAGRAWSEGRIDEWRLMPFDQRTLLAGQIAAWALPIGASIAAGGAVAAVVCWSSWRVGFAAPLLAPLEGLLLLADVWAAVYLAACVGTWSGNRTRRVWPATLLALTAGSPPLILLTCALAVAFDRGLLGIHLILVGAPWLAGNGFRAAAERRIGH
jgi:hypothetical protein